MDRTPSPEHVSPSGAVYEEVRQLSQKYAQISMQTESFTRYELPLEEAKQMYGEHISALEKVFFTDYPENADDTVITVILQPPDLDPHEARHIRKRIDLFKNRGKYESFSSITVDDVVEDDGAVSAKSDERTRLNGHRMIFPSMVRSTGRASVQVQFNGSLVQSTLEEYSDVYEAQPEDLYLIGQELAYVREWHEEGAV